ncbi:hypothetical protein KP509_1Z279500 [Ceratopteris richardii]|nr:hypothetical protein KP509_1Z279500 [Ceratopteris richardii]
MYIFQTLGKILNSFNSGLSQEKWSNVESSVRSPILASQKDIHSHALRSSRQVQNTTKRSGYSTCHDLDTGKGVNRPLSLLVGGPLMEITSGRRIHDTFQNPSWKSSMRPDHSPASRSHDTSNLKLAFQQNKLAFGHAKKVSHSGKVQSSFQLQLKPFPWEKTTPWEGSSLTKDTMKNDSPLSIEIPSREISFWRILRMHPHAVKLNQFMDSKYWACLIVPAVVIALFSHNIIRAFFPKTADPYLIYIYLMCLGLFVFELVALSIVRKDYFLGLSF